MKKPKKAHCSWHHRRPRSLQGTDSPENLVQVSDTKHSAWHTLFSNHTPQEIADIINAVWLDPEFVFLVERRKR